MFIFTQKNNYVMIALSLIIMLNVFGCGKTDQEKTEPQGVKTVQPEMEIKEQKDQRMNWWREARFGMFIHWGLYAIPAGEWKGETNHAEWILTTAQIPVNEYEKFTDKFNPIKFNAEEWVRVAKKAGMKYIVITSKHHDGFCLFDSDFTDYDVMDATPFKRDIMRELADECREQGIQICWYHSIMDWHHLDYLPRRKWENRPEEGADFDRYADYMKSQVKELLENYGEIGVLWFDGEWESTWDRERGVDLYKHVRSLQPNIIINNRVGKGRAGMAGTYDPENASGDFGTPEQEIPATGLSYDWETCMTMNDHWGYNKYDDNWKSTEDLLKKLVDISSKGGNFLLNVGPTSEGLFPPESVDRLEEIGLWMEVNGDGIYGTTASLFEKLAWGRSTTKANTLYFFVFDWPENGILEVPGLLSEVKSARLLAEPDMSLDVLYKEGVVKISLPEIGPDPYVSVIVCEFQEKPEVVRPPIISAENDIFCDSLDVIISSHLDNIQIRYTIDGSEPDVESKLYENGINISESTVIKCRLYRDGRAISPVVISNYKQVIPRPSVQKEGLESGLDYEYFHGEWDKLPDFNSIQSITSGQVRSFEMDFHQRPENFGFRINGFIKVPKDGVYKFFLASDDGSRLLINDQMVIDNDGLHGAREFWGRIALQAGLHPIAVEFFQRTGGIDFEVAYSGPGIEKHKIPSEILFHE